MERPEGTQEPAIGESLAEARESRGLDLRDVEAETKIRLKYLRALEDGDWDVLPGPAYAVGFLRTYAELVGLDANRLAAELRTRLDAAAPAEQRYPAGEPVLSGRERSGPPRRGLRLFAVIAILLLLAAAGLTVVAMVTDEDAEPDGAGAGGGGGARGERSNTDDAASQESQGPMDLLLNLRADVSVCLLGDGARPLIDNQVLGAGSEERFTAERFELRFPDGFERSQLRLELDGEPTPLKPSVAPTAFKIEGVNDVRATSAHAGACP